MARVLTNNTSFAYAIQEGYDTLGGDPDWKLVEPNGGIVFGAAIKTQQRRPISKRRSRRKGAPVDLDSPVGYESDLTMDALIDGAEGFLYSRAAGYDLIFRAADATGTSDVFAVPALSASQAARIQWVTGAEATLLWAVGYDNAGNNGLHVLTANATATDTTLTVTGSTLVTETAPANAELSVCGIRAGTSDLSITVSAGIATLTSAANLDFTSLGWVVGQFIHVGGVTTANQFSAGAGFGRLRSIAAGTVTLDKLDDTLATDTGTGENVDILYGRFVRDVATDNASYLERYFQFEAGFDDLFETTPPTPVANPDGFEYALNNLCDEMQFGFPATAFQTLKLGFVGSDTEPAVSNASRKTNADTPRSPLFTAPFSTASSYSRLRIADTDETDITTDFVDWSLTVKSNVSGEKVQGFFGSKFLNTGGFEVDLSGTFVFTSASVSARIRNNTTVTFDTIAENEDGAYVIDLPAMTLGDGARDYALNESVKVKLNGEVFEDPTLGYSIGLSLFPVTPTSYAA